MNPTNQAYSGDVLSKRFRSVQLNQCDVVIESVVVEAWVDDDFAHTDGGFCAFCYVEIVVTSANNVIILVMRLDRWPRIRDFMGLQSFVFGLEYASTNTDNCRPIKYRIRSPTNRITNIIPPMTFSSRSDWRRGDLIYHRIRLLYIYLSNKIYKSTSA